MPEHRITEVWHDNVPEVGMRHKAEDCPGGPVWPCCTWVEPLVVFG